MSNANRYRALLSLALCLFGLLWATAPQKRAPHHHRHRRASPGRIAEQVVSYDRDIRPILVAHCCRCHGPSRARAGLRLDTPLGIRKGSDGGAILVPGDPSNSKLFAVVSGTEEVDRMPPSGKPLTASEVALLRAWINAGAPAPADGIVQAPPIDHWAFRPPRRPPVPAVANAPWKRNPIDTFLAAGYEQQRLTPARPAARGLLLRRVFLDLVGLPPSLEERRAFLADRSENAVDKMVDRLLASPHYGERWGRHWMDIWRYSDADGRKLKKETYWSSDDIWRWRDWIIASLNADNGYDRMVAEMLAGDELASTEAEALAATGYLVRNCCRLDRNASLNAIVEHTGKAFLGLTIGCARCHDHKFDPISQRDYYAFRAFFEPHDIRIESLPAHNGRRSTLTHAYDARPTEPTWLLVRGDERTPDRSAPVAPAVPLALAGPPLRVWPIEVTFGKKRMSTGRRLALARWLTDRRNPLAARVAVNHIWARHFGTPLVESVADFGLRSPPPPQQRLMDWLAIEFMDHGWSMKWLHRLIVTSAAYRMQSATRGASSVNLAVDPDNRAHWHMNATRMEAEVIRDSLLHLSGELDLAMGGPPLACHDSANDARRSIYHRYSREDKLPFLATFDAASVDECYRRQQSIVPQQAFALENSAFVWHRSRRIARILDPTSARPALAFVSAAFAYLLGRPPTAPEQKACLDFLRCQEQVLANPWQLTPLPPVDPIKTSLSPDLPLTLGEARPLAPVAPSKSPRARARECLIHALINHNDFLTIR
jgi:hypothetical protein